MQQHSIVTLLNQKNLRGPKSGILYLQPKSRAACGPIPLPFSVAFPPEMVDFWESKMGNHENSEPDHLKYHFLNQHLKKPTKFRF